MNEVTYENAVLTTDKTDPTKVTDGDITTEFWLKSSAGDRIDKDAAVILDLGSAQPSVLCMLHRIQPARMAAISSGTGS